MTYCHLHRAAARVGIPCRRGLGARTRGLRQDRHVNRHRVGQQPAPPRQALSTTTYSRPRPRPSFRVSIVCKHRLPLVGGGGGSCCNDRQSSSTIVHRCRRHRRRAMNSYCIDDGVPY